MQGFKKIAIVGVGQVGSAIARRVIEARLAEEVALIDKKSGVAEGNILDILHGCALQYYYPDVYGGSHEEYLRGADLVIIATDPCGDGENSDTTIQQPNLADFDTVLQSINEYAPDSSLLIVTNPVDSLTYYAYKKLGWERHRIFGLGGLLGSTRLASVLSQYVDMNVKKVETMVVGSHGELMLPLYNYSYVNERSVTSILTDAELEQIDAYVQQLGEEIVTLRGKTAFEAPAACVVQMLNQMILGVMKPMSVVTVLDGEYELSNLAMSVPVLMDKNGIKEVVQLPLTDQQQIKLFFSAEHVRLDIRKVFKAA